METNQTTGRTRELALILLGIDSKLRGCDLVALNLGRGTNAASRCLNSSSDITQCVVPSRQGDSSFSCVLCAASQPTSGAELPRAYAYRQHRQADSGVEMKRSWDRVPQ